jgi:hypothetical protein
MTYDFGWSSADLDHPWRPKSQALRRVELQSRSPFRIQRPGSISGPFPLEFTDWLRALAVDTLRSDTFSIFDELATAYRNTRGCVGDAFHWGDGGKDGEGYGSRGSGSGDGGGYGDKGGVGGEWGSHSPAK